jgi:hypothetical protein
VQKKKKETNKTKQKDRKSLVKYTNHSVGVGGFVGCDDDDYLLDWSKSVWSCGCE